MCYTVVVIETVVSVQDCLSHDGVGHDYHVEGPLEYCCCCNTSRIVRVGIDQ